MVLPALGFLASIGMASKGLGDIAKGAVEATKAMANFPGLLTAWSDGLTQSSRNLSQYNASLAKSVAQLDMEKFKLARAESAALAPGLMELNKEVASLQKELLPAKVAMEELKGVVTVKILQLLTVGVELLKHLPYIGEYLEEIERNTEKDMNVGSPAATFLQNLSDGKFSGFRNGPT